MKLALDLANKTRNQTSPNPSVGAVIVKNNNIIGFGAHLQAVESHAEVTGLYMAREKAKDASMYVTLEPCSHVRKSASCAEAILESDLKKVHIETEDPNERVAGKGIEKLKSANVEVTTGLLKYEAQEINKHFFTSMMRKRPFITLKQPTSLD